MTELRPESDSASPYGDSYGDTGAFEAAVGRLDDPLNDPLPGQASPQVPRQVPGQASGQAPGLVPEQSNGQLPGRQGSPWFRPREEPEPGPGAASQSTSYGQGYAAKQQGQEYAPSPEGGQSYTTAEAWRIVARTPAPEAYAAPADATAPDTPADPVAPAVRRFAEVPFDDKPFGDEPFDSETVALRVAEPRAGGRGAAGSPESGPPQDGGRAARRRAAKQRGGRRARGRRPAHGAAATASAATASAATASAATASAAAVTAPRSRVEARRQARARKDPPGVIASRAIGETFITLGVLMLLFVTYQLWYTNILAQQEAGGAANNLQNRWDEGGEGDRKPDAFSPGQGFAIMYIPKLDVKVPIAEGIDKQKVLDRGMVGHYSKGRLKTAMPWQKGNFAVAGHRNTHGEPFRYINRLKPGDEIIVETQSTYYTYEMASILPQTSPRNIDVIEPVPPGSGFTKPGRYITLTTCTPEFTSTYRMIVWGRMADERPRSEGKPDALVA
ncbi:class E sortase [Streptomyces sp. NPDC004647]|uniref:class E sortase n=1 Tax=Streptomyces sp. NPDC004647 TaxID=3154671 RepID=UPI0033A2591E